MVVVGFGTHPSGLRGYYGLCAQGHSFLVLLRIKPGMDACKTNALTAVLSITPPLQISSLIHHLLSDSFNELENKMEMAWIYYHNLEKYFVK